MLGCSCVELWTLYTMLMLTIAAEGRAELALGLGLTALLRIIFTLFV